MKQIATITLFFLLSTVLLPAQSLNYYGESIGLRGFGITETPDDGLFITGQADRGGTRGIDMLLMNVDSAGNLLMSKYFGTNGTDVGRTIRDADGDGLIIAGNSNYGNSAWNIGDIVVTDLDYEANVNWQKAIYSSNTTNRNDWAVDVICDTTQDSYLVWSMFRGSNLPNVTDQHLMWLDPDNGTVNSDRLYRPAGTQTDSPQRILRSKHVANRYYAVGWYYPSLHEGTLYALNDTSGAVDWSRRFKISGEDHCFPFDMAEDSSGNVWVVGTHTFSGYSQPKGFIASFDSSGTALGIESFTLDASSGYVNVRSVEIDGNYLVIGGYETSSVGAANGSAFILKYDVVNEAAVWAKRYGESGDTTFIDNHGSLIISSRHAYVMTGTRAGTPDEVMLVIADTSGNSGNCGESAEPWVTSHTIAASSLSDAGTTTSTSSSDSTTSLTMDTVSVIDKSYCGTLLAAAEVTLAGELRGDGAAVLTWTMTGRGNGVFRIERAEADGSQWRVLGERNSDARSFVAADHAGLGQAARYRIRFGQAGGGTVRSNAVELRAGGAEVRVFPTVLEAGADLYVVPGGAEGTVRVTDLRGSVIVRSRRLEARLRLPCAGWAPGLYFVEVTAGGSRTVKKVLLR